MNSKRTFPPKFKKFTLSHLLEKTSKLSEVEAPQEADHPLYRNTRVDSEVVDLSVIVPIYGAEKYLEKCLVSILECPKYKIEVIALNDGSPDGSDAVCRELEKKHAHLRYIKHENIGGAPTINKGLGLANGNFVMIVDNDDWVSPVALAQALDVMYENTVDFVSTKIIKASKGREEETYDTKYIKKQQIVTAKKLPAIINDSMYLGKIFRRRFLDFYNIKMDPNLLFADRPFVNTASALAKQIMLLPIEFYHWRQREDGGSITDESASIKNLSDRIHSCRVTKFELAARGFSYWNNTVDYFTVNRFFWSLKNSSYSFLREFAEISRTYFNEIDEDSIKNLTPAQLYFIKALKNNSNEVFPFLIYKRKFFHQLKKNSMRLVKGTIALKELPNTITKKLNNKASKNRLKELILNEVRDPQLVVFENNFGKAYGGQPKYIYEEMLRQNKSFRAVWIYQSQKLKGLPGNALQLRRGSDEYFRALARAKYWVNNIRFTVTNKPKDTIYLQTWHGTPLKRLGLDIEVSGPEAEARAHFLKESANWDYMLAQNDFASKKFEKAFAVKGKMLPYGYPANDVFYDDDVEKKKIAFHSEHDIPIDRKLILYAPTWRDDARKGDKWEYSFDLELDLAKMQEELGEEYHLLLRLHHLIADGLDLSAYKGFATDVSKVDDTSDLLVVTDVMITDYSSIFFDFACSKRSMLFYMYDVEKYASELRGFYLDVDKDLPGPIIKDFETLISSLKNLDQIDAEYRDRMEEFYERICSKQDGKVAQRIVDEVFVDLPTHDKS